MGVTPSMTRDELQRMRDWAHDKIAAGAEPPWSWYQYMKLREALDAILAGMASTEPVTLPEDSRPEGSRPGSGHLRLVRIDQPESAQPGQEGPPVPLPM